MKKLQDFDKVKIEIIKASGNVFMKYGFSRISMKDISKASGKGRTTLYYYFKNKSEVLDAFAADQFDLMLTASQKNLAEAAGFVSNIESYYKTKLELLKLFLTQYSALIDDLKTNPSFFIQNKSKLFFKEEVEVITQIILWAIKKAEIVPLKPDDVTFLGNTLVTAFRSFEQEMLLYGGMENFENKLSWLTQILYKGLK